MKKKLRAFLHDEDGATAIEYGLIIGFIAIAIIASIRPIGGKLNNTFNNASNGFTSH